MTSHRTPGHLVAGVLLACTLALSACAQEQALAPSSLDRASGSAATESSAAGLQALGDLEDQGEPADGDVSTSSAHADSTAPAATAGRRLVRDVTLRLRVGDTEAAAAALEQTTADLGGFVASVESHRVNELYHFTMVLRVPTGRLDEAVRQAKELAEEIDHERRGVRDVTDQFVDLEARLRTLEATEAELRVLLAESRQRRYEVEQVMAVYERLNEIRTRIEQIQGRLQVLGDLTALGTLRVELAPTEAARPVVEEGWHPGATAKRALRGLVAALQGLGDVAIVLLIQVLPVLLLLALILWGVARLWRRWRPFGPPTQPEPRPDPGTDD